MYCTFIEKFIKMAIYKNKKYSILWSKQQLWGFYIFKVATLVATLKKKGARLLGQPSNQERSLENKIEKLYIL
jgi:hypothetical protein